MKKFMMIMVALVGIVTFANANPTPIPFAYKQTLEWVKLDAKMQKELLSYANAGAYNASVEIKADSILNVTMVKGVKSRSGKTEDQVWIQVQEAGKVVNYLFSLSNLPKIVSDPTTGKLTISAHRGDSDTGPALARNPW